MAHAPKPFFRTARNAWYVQIGTKQYKLCDGPKNTGTEKTAWSAFHAIMASRPVNDNLPPSPTTFSANSASPSLSVGCVFEKYLDWCHKHREQRTYTGYVWYLQKFCDHFKLAAKTEATALRPFHIIEWLDAHPTWGATYRRQAIGAIQRAYNWAEELGYISNNPIRKIKKPTAARREEYITPEDWVKIRDSYKEGDPFRLFLEFCWETGARPQEARAIERRHVHLEKSLIAIPPKEAKGKKRWRLIRLEGRAAEIIRQQMTTDKELLFCNRNGKPWTAFSINCRFCRLKVKLGVKFCNYQFRHGFANKLLVNGVDHLTVAALLGHSDGQMVSKVYSHVHQDDEHLRKVLRKSSSQDEDA